MSPAPGAPGEVAGSGIRWKLISTLALIGAVVGFVWGVADRPLYEATSTVVVEGKITEEPTGLERLAAGGASAEVAIVAAGLLGDDIAGADLLSDVTIEPGADGFTLDVVARSELPDFAAASADAFAEALAITADEDAKDGEGPITAGASAEVPPSPVENRSAPLWALTGLAAGLLLGLGASIVGRRSRGSGIEAPAPWEGRAEDDGEHEGDEEYEDEDEDEEEYEDEEDDEQDESEAAPSEEPAGLEPLAVAFGVPVLATLAGSGETPAPAGPGFIQLNPDDAALFRRLAEDLGLVATDPPRTLAVLDAVAPDAAGEVAWGIAAAAADLGLRVVVVEADLERPSLAGRFGVDEDPGLRDYLGGEASPREVLRRVRVALGGEERVSLVAVPAGGTDESGVTTIAGARFDALVERLPRVYDLVVFEAPPLLADGDATIVAGSVDGIVLVAPDEEESRSAIERCARILAGEPLLGGVLTEVGSAEHESL